jgi:WD40 repeat protein
VRLWDAQNTIKNESVFVCKPKSGTGRLQVNSCTFNYTGDRVVAGCSDGSFQLFDPKRMSTSRPDKIVYNAHQPSNDITSIIFSLDDKYFYSRSLDGTLKAWDVRNPNAPVHTVEDLICTYSESDISLASDGEMILAGTSVIPKSEGMYGYVFGFSRSTLGVVHSIPIGQTSVIRVVQHSVLNQLILGCSDGCHVLYDPSTSRNGALLCADRAPRSAELSDLARPLHIITPHALRMYREVPSRKRAKEEANVPERPVRGAGHGGRLGSSVQSGFLLSMMSSSNSNVTWSRVGNESSSP